MNNSCCVIEFPECAICLNFFDHFSQYPYVLSCGHSFCKTCLTELFDNSHRNQSWNVSQSDIACGANMRILIRCPECNVWIRQDGKGVSALPKNIELMRLVDRLLIQKQKLMTPLETPEELKAENDVSQNGFPNLRISAKAPNDELSTFKEPDEVLEIESAKQPPVIISDASEPVSNAREDGTAHAKDTEESPCFENIYLKLTGHRDQVSVLLVRGNQVFSASLDKTIKIWCNKTGKLLHTLQSHNNRVTSIAAANDNRRIISADYGAQICIWDWGEEVDKAPVMVATWKDHNDWQYFGVLSLAVSEAGILFTGGGDRSVKAWSLEDFSLLSTLTGHKGPVSSLATADGILYSGSWDGTIRLWYTADLSELSVLSSASPSIRVVGVRCLKLWNDLLICGRDDGTIQVWKNHSLVSNIPAHANVVSAIQVHAGWLYSGSWDGHIEARKFEHSILSNEPSWKFLASVSPITAIAFSVDLFCIGSGDGMVQIRKRN